MSTALQKNRFGHLLPAGLPEFDNLFNHFFRAGRSAPCGVRRLRFGKPTTRSTSKSTRPASTKEDVELTFDKGALQITLERKAPKGERTNWHNERGYGKVSRSVSLPDTVDPETITAELATACCT